MFVEERKEGRMGINANVLGKWREREREENSQGN